MMEYGIPGRLQDSAMWKLSQLSVYLPLPVCVSMCVRTCRRSEVNLFLDAVSLLFESESLVGTWGLLFRLDWLLREPQGLACAYLPRTVISGAHL